MNKRFIEIAAKATEARTQLAQEHPQYQKHVKALDRIIWGTGYVKRLLIIAILFFVLFGFAFMYLMYPEFMMMAIALGVAVGGCIFCWAVGVIQLKLYDRTINKIRSSG